jgi:hypothetical protein
MHFLCRLVKVSNVKDRVMHDLSNLKDTQLKSSVTFCVFWFPSTYYTFGLYLLTSSLIHVLILALSAQAI